MWIPESIYRKLPALYALAGAALIPVFGFSGPSAISALMLFAASGLTALWRRQHQQASAGQAQPGSHRPRDEWAQRRVRRHERMKLK